MSAVPPPCNPEIYKSGSTLVVLSGHTNDIEPWVQRVAQESGQAVDWHFAGGRAQVLVLGDHAKALAVAKKLAPEFKGEYAQVLAWYEPTDSGLYRAGVTPAPEDAIAVDPELGFIVAQ